MTVVESAARPDQFDTEVFPSVDDVVTPVERIISAHHLVPNSGKTLILAERIPGTMTTELPHLGLAIDIVRGHAFVKSIDRLTKISIGIHMNVYGRGYEFSKRAIEINMGRGIKDIKKEELIPSALYFRTLTTPEYYAGMSIQQVLKLNTQLAGDIYTLLMRRAIESDFRDMDFGKMAAEFARMNNPIATWGAHRTQVETAVRAMQNARIFKPGRYFPVDATYDTDRLARQIMNRLFDTVGNKGKTVDQVYGVSEGDYELENIANDIDITRPSIRPIHELMYKKAKMNAKRGDAMYLVGEFR